MIIWAVVAVSLLIMLYWVRVNYYHENQKRRPSGLTLFLVGMALVLVVWLIQSGRPDHVYQANENPIAISVAFDLSPSMLAIPDPAVYPDEVSRFEQGLAVLKELFRSLDENQEDIIVSMIGFTKSAEVIMGWESNISQVQEILEYIISPNLFTSSGTSIESSIQTLADNFNRLPLKFQENSRKVAILVSDGEDTTPYSYMDYVEKQLESGTFDLVALHTGSLDLNEGVPRYGEFGEFLGFQIMGGRIYTIPDVDTMTRVVNAAPRGLYVRAKSTDAVRLITGFLGSESDTDSGVDLRIGILLGLFVVVALLCGRLVL